MNLDDLLQRRRKLAEETSQVMRRSDQCLRFAELERSARDPDSVDPSSHNHLHSCDRCRGLRDRFVALRQAGPAEAPLDDIDEEPADSIIVNRSRRVWRIAATVLPLASAACLVLAIGIWLRVPSPEEALSSDLIDHIEAAAKELDGRYFNLTERDRAGQGPAELSKISEQRRLAIEQLLKTLGDLAEEAREVRRAAESAEPESEP